MHSVRSKELESRCRLLAERLTESAVIVDHDPSLALYRLHEHMNRSLPVLVKARIGLGVSAQRMAHLQRDLDNAIGVADSMQRASSSLENSTRLIRECARLQRDAAASRPPPERGARSQSFHGRRSTPT